MINKEHPVFLHFCIIHVFSRQQGLWEGGSTGTSVRGQESQEGASESMKGPIALAIDVLFRLKKKIGGGGIFN